MRYTNKIILLNTREIRTLQSLFTLCIGVITSIITLPNIGSMTLTEEQKKFLEECEEEFENRYTESDSEFIKVKNMELITPPIMDPWHNKPRRSQDDWSQNQGHGRRNNSWDRRNNDRNRDGWGRHEKRRRYK